MTETERIAAATVWVAGLARLTRHGAAPPPDDETLTLYGEMLARTFNEAAFSIAALDAVSEGMQFFPDLDTLRKRLAAWWRDHQSQTRALPPPPDAQRATLSVMDEKWLQRWKHHEASSFAEIKPPAGVSARAHFLSLLKSRAYAVWVLVSGEADNLATLDWKDPAKVAASVRGVLAPLPNGGEPAPGHVKMCLDLLRGLVAKHAPENVYLVPHSPAVFDRPEQRPGMNRRGGALTPEQLAAMRKPRPPVTDPTEPTTEEAPDDPAYADWPG